MPSTSSSSSASSSSSFRPSPQLELRSLFARSITSIRSIPRPRPSSFKKSPLRVWPFVLITVLGTSTYVLMVKSRAATHPRKGNNTVGIPTRSTLLPPAPPEEKGGRP
ncbi:MAG: hypothetical protein M1826_001480 [Phylliscum demangeonii]|nr:MAG: hypothetical protein M1826_001480 [Phylliscum demangeonii]